MRSAAESDPHPPGQLQVGKGTSAQQVEGMLEDGAAGRSTWGRLRATLGHIVGGDLQDVACEHYRLYKDDVGLMRKLGLNGYQFSARAACCPTAPARSIRPGSTSTTGSSTSWWLPGLLMTSVIYMWELPERLADLGGWTNRDCASCTADDGGRAVRQDRLLGRPLAHYVRADVRRRLRRRGRRAGTGHPRPPSRRAAGDAQRAAGAMPDGRGLPRQRRHGRHLGSSTGWRTSAPRPTSRPTSRRAKRVNAYDHGSTSTRSCAASTRRRSSSASPIRLAALPGSTT